MKRLVLFLLVACAGLFAETVSLDTVFEYAAKNSVGLEMKRLDAEMGKSDVESAEADYYPAFNLVYNTEYTESLDGIPLGTESVGGITISNGTRYQNSAALQMTYSLYTFGATEKAVLAARRSAEAAEKERCLKEKELFLQILQKYADALKLAEEMHYKKEMLLLRRKIYAAKERLYKAGHYSKVDLGDEAIYIISLERERENASLQYREDLLEISRLSYMPIGFDVTLMPIGEDKSLSETVPFEKTAEAFVLKKRIEAKKAELDMHERRQYPSFSMYGNYYLYASDPRRYYYPLRHLHSKSWNIGFSIRMNLFEGFRDSAKARRLSLELKKAQEAYEEAKHKYLYEGRDRRTRLDELAVLQKKDEKLREQNRKKAEMVKRLRKYRKVDLLAQLNAQYELMERTLNLEKRKIERAATMMSLKISERGPQQCTQR
ncbi:TolC family protein [Hydrogenimonas sp. SS33]|uniref:TolC family protein n=1 Tax=Hydrogenimonas leucolamina TaxID=2954236 RepID=UPI00336BBC14